MLLRWWRAASQRSSRSTARRASRPKQWPHTGFKPHVEALEDRTLMNAGALDTTFGTGGLLTTNLSYTALNSNSVAVQPDGKILVAGVSTAANVGEFSVARFNADGSLDTTFGGTGLVSANIALGSTDQAVGLVLQPDGKVVVAGDTNAGGAQENFGVMRFNPDGSIDTTFGNNGSVIIDFYNGDDYLSAIGLEPNGRIVVAGRSDTHFALARLNADGSQDADFDGDGKLMFDFAATITGGKLTGSTDGINALTIQQNGDIVVAGFTNVSVDLQYIATNPILWNFALGRFNYIDGTLDTKFGRGGLQVVDYLGSPNGNAPNGPSDIATSITTLSDGRLAVAGWTEYGGGGQNYDLAILTTLGVVDPTFNADGEVVTDFSPNFQSGSLGQPDIQDQANGITVQPDGHIVLAGFSGQANTASNADPQPPATSAFSLARYNPDGTLDQNFGFHGLVTTKFNNNSLDNITDVVMQPNGAILAVGTSDDQNGNGPHLVMARYTGLVPDPISFTASAYSSLESSGAATISVTRGGDISSAATIQFATSDGTAKAGKNYAARTGTLSFSAGQANASFVVPLIDDNVFQSPNLSLNLTLSNPQGGGAILGNPTTAVLTILESDHTTRTQNYIIQVYQDLLHQTPSPAALAKWTHYLNSGGSKANFVLALENTSAYRQLVVQGIFTKYLRRSPSGTELSHYTHLLATGSTDEQVAAQVGATAEYYNNYGGGTPSSWVANFFQDATGHAIDAGSLSTYTNQLAKGSTRYQVALEILTSNAYRLTLISNWYQLYVHHAINSKTLNGYLSLMRGGGSLGQQSLFLGDPGALITGPLRDERIIALILSSKPYLAQF
jgi:uncharacterized delta-60 repeat protein